jgi:hypothetical protein
MGLLHLHLLWLPSNNNSPIHNHNHSQILRILDQAPVAVGEEEEYSNRWIEEQILGVCSCLCNRIHIIPNINIKRLDNNNSMLHSDISLLPLNKLFLHRFMVRESYRAVRRLEED